MNDFRARCRAFLDAPIEQLEDQWATGIANPCLPRLRIAAGNIPAKARRSKYLPVNRFSLSSMGNVAANSTTVRLRKGTRTSNDAAMLARSTLKRMSPSRYSLMSL